MTARKTSGSSQVALPQGVTLSGEMLPRYDEVLTSEALALVADLHRSFEARRRQILNQRQERQSAFDAGELPDFLEETRHIRESDWAVGPIPPDLRDRRVEITGPVDRKMIVNALNSGAKVFMADFEDASSPTWANMVEGQVNLRDRWRGELDFTDPESGKAYRLDGKTAVLIARPRGWHLDEAHLQVDGEVVAGALFDFGLYLFHNAANAQAAGSGPYFYLPKLEGRLEARLWNDVFVHAQRRLGLPVGAIKATVLIETLPAAFEMDEILHELRDHIVGLNAGRWDYVFSFIKKLRHNPNFIMPDRGQVVMGKAFLGAYSQLLIETCHRRGALAMGGMAAEIPNRRDAAANEAAFAEVRADKRREAGEGHDGTWVAHPDLVPVAEEIFDEIMPGPNQLDRRGHDAKAGQKHLLEVHQGTRTESGLRENIRVGVQYIEAWLRGRGAVPIYYRMEDAATVEISRAQVWQWLRHGVTMENGRKVTADYVLACIDEEMQQVRHEIGDAAYDEGQFPAAIELFKQSCMPPEFPEFLTIPAYELLTQSTR